MRYLSIQLFTIAVVVTITQAVAVESVSAAPVERPNIIFIMADDMGYGDARCNNPQSQIPTPALDRMAREGMRMTDAHTPSAVCTPTRYGVLTGRYCWRSRLKRGVLNGYGTPLIEKERPTVASFLREHGYSTAIVGKWHLGLEFARDSSGQIDYRSELTDSPREHGFDYSYIIPASLDFPPYVYIENGRVTEPETVDQPSQSFPAYLRSGPRSKTLVMENCLDDLLAKAVERIDAESKTESPFFLYFSLTAPHKPVLPHPRFRGKTKLGPYGDFVVQVDWTVGQVIDAVDRSGIKENTLVIYTSDNGSFMYRLDEGIEDHVDNETVQGYRAAHHCANGPLRGTKADVWDAGHRVPFLVRWPAVVKPGSQCDSTLCLTDLFATTADIVDENPAVGAAADSFSFLPHLMGQSPVNPRPPVIHHSASGMFAIRDGRMKLVLGDGSGGREQPKGQPFSKPYVMFDMDEDIGETEDVIEKHQATAEKLEKACHQIIDNERGVQE